MKNLVSRFIKDESGATAIEYGLIAVLIGVAIIAGATARWLLVSGNGYFGHGGHVTGLDSTRWASQESGYMRLDGTRQGRVRLSVMTVNQDAESEESYSLWLSDGGRDEECQESSSERCNPRR